jgi:hypothetical protein
MIALLRVMRLLLWWPCVVVVYGIGVTMFCCAVVLLWAMTMVLQCCSVVASYSGYVMTMLL